MLSASLPADWLPAFTWVGSHDGSQKLRILSGSSFALYTRPTVTPAAVAMIENEDQGLLSFLNEVPVDVPHSDQHELESYLADSST